MVAWVGATERLMTHLEQIAGRPVMMRGRRVLLGGVEVVVEGAAKAVPDVALDRLVRVVRASGSGDDAVVHRARSLSDVVVTSDRGLRARVPRTIPRVVVVGDAGLMDGKHPEKFAWLSLATGFVVLALKLVAWQVTGSVGLLSDAMESTVNIGAALVAVFALRASNRPPDAEHHFGHGKAEYLRDVRRLFILAASAAIIATAVNRLLNPQELEQVGIGLAISVLASVLNGAVGVLLLRVGRKHRSMVLVADGKHLLTDVWTSVGVVFGVAAVALTGWSGSTRSSPWRSGRTSCGRGGVAAGLQCRPAGRALSDDEIDKVVSVLERRMRVTRSISTRCRAERQDGNVSCPCTCSSR